MGTKITVYRFRRVANGRDISPRTMLGTLDAIKRLGDSVAIHESAQVVERARLEEGFLFESSVDIKPIEMPDPGLL